MNEKLNRADWEIQHIQTLKALQKKSTKVQTLIGVIDNPSSTQFQKNMVKNVLDSDYKSYCVKFDFDKTKKKSDENYSKLVYAVKKEKQKSIAQSRKARAHELITIGTLTDVTNFEKDRGLIAGVFLDALERFKKDEQLKWDLKKRGDELLHELEKQKDKKNNA